MPLHKENSVWREKRWQWHGEEVFEEMKIFGKKLFEVRDVAGLDSLNHLADTTAYDTASAILSYLENNNMIKRVGKLFKLKRNK